MSPTTTGVVLLLLCVTDWVSSKDNKELDYLYNATVTGPVPVVNSRNTTLLVSPSGRIVEGMNVTLSCHTEVKGDIFWWGPQNQRHPIGREEKLELSSIRTSDSGRYHCLVLESDEGVSPFPVYIDVMSAPRAPSVTLNTSGEISEFSSVILTCHSKAEPTVTKYKWMKKRSGAEPQSVSDGHQLIFGSVQASDSGEYFCKAENEVGQNESESVRLDVQYGPRQPSVSVSPSEAIEEGHSVTLSCSSEANPAVTKYSLFKKSPGADPQPLSDGAQFVVGSVQASHSGEYFCKAENKLGHNTSDSFRLDVEYGPRLPSVSVCPSGALEEGRYVTLTCHSDANPEATYSWYKEKEDSPKASGQSYTISHFRTEHVGKYYCEASNSRGRHNSTLQSITLESAVFVETLKLSKNSLVFALALLLLLALVPLLILVYMRLRRKRKQSYKVRLIETIEVEDEDLDVSSRENGRNATQTPAAVSVTKL